PILGAFLLMEASGLGGPMMGLVLLPGLLAAGIGSLIFIGLDSWTGLGTFTLAIPGLPQFSSPTIGEFGWALVIGVAAALVGTGIRGLGRLLRPYARRWALRAGPWRGWRSPTPKAPAKPPPTCCSRGSPRSRTSSSTAPTTPSGRCCC